MEKIKVIDAQILSQFQRFCDWLTKMFGIKNSPIKLSYIILSIQTLIIPCALILDYFYFHNKNDRLITCLFICSIFFLSAVWGVRKIDKEKKSDLANIALENFAIKGPEKYFGDRMSFLIFIFIYPVMFLVQFTEPFLDESLLWMIELYVVLGLLFYYVLNCTPLPPTKSKLRQWIDSFSVKVAPVKNSSK